MLGFSKRTDYALLALDFLAHTGTDRAVRAREVAQSYDIPLELLAKILQKLAKVGIVVSAPGPTGGYILARSPHEISIGAVVEAIEGTPALIPCMKTVEMQCDQHTKCTIRSPMERVSARVHNLLNEITLSDIGDGGTVPEDDGVIRISAVKAPVRG